MGFRYAIIGSGRQGTAAAYDLARFGDAAFLLLADQSLAFSERAAARVNSLVGRAVAHPAQVDVQDVDAVVKLLTGNDIAVFVSGVPYFFNTDLARAAIRARASMCDFGGNTEQVRRQTPSGGVPVELAVPGPLFVEEFHKRGFDLQETWAQ